MRYADAGVPEGHSGRFWALFCVPPTPQSQQRGLACCQAEGHADYLVINAHVESIEVKKEAAGFHAGALVAVVEYMPHNDAPADGGGLSMRVG